MAGMAMESRPLAVWAFQDCHTSAIPLIQGMAGMANMFSCLKPGNSAGHPQAHIRQGIQPLMRNVPIAIGGAVLRDRP
jgi:hypothetical protein